MKKPTSKKGEEKIKEIKKEWKVSNNESVLPAFEEKSWSEEEELKSVTSGNNSESESSQDEQEQKFEECTDSGSEKEDDPDRTESSETESESDKEDSEKEVLDLPNGNIAQDNNFKFKIVKFY